MAGDDDLGRPPSRLYPQQAEFWRQKRRILFRAGNPGIYAIDESRYDRFPPGVIMPELGFHIPAKAEKSGANIALELPGAKDFCNCARSLTAPEFELESPVAGSIVTLGKEEIRFILCIDMGNTPLIGQNFYGSR